MNEVTHNKNGFEQTKKVPVTSELEEFFQFCYHFGFREKCLKASVKTIIAIEEERGEIFRRIVKLIMTDEVEDNFDEVKTCWGCEKSFIFTNNYNDSQILQKNGTKEILKICKGT